MTRGFKPHEPHQPYQQRVKPQRNGTSRQASRQASRQTPSAPQHVPARHRNTRGQPASQWRSSLISLAVTVVVVLGLVAVVHAVATSTSGGSATTATNGSSGSSSSSAGAPTATSSTLAPLFTLTTLSGAPFSLASAHGHPVVLYFMATTCSTCVQGSGEVVQAVQAAHVAGAQAVAIDITASDTSSDLASFVQTTGVPATAPMVWGIDTTDQITSAYGVLALETTVVIDAQGRIAYENPGPVPPSQLTQIIQKAA